VSLNATMKYSIKNNMQSIWFLGARNSGTNWTIFNPINVGDLNVHQIILNLIGIFGSWKINPALRRSQLMLFTLQFF
jgi:hypothetical protein